MDFFSSYSVLLQGFIPGLIFGFLLRKGLVTRFSTIVGQFLLLDFTVLKVMLTAILVGSVGMYAMDSMGTFPPLPIEPALLLANIGGGVLFGLGMAILGLCPGTCVGAVGDGSKDARYGILGMIVGAALFAEVYEWISSLFLCRANLGPVTLSSLTGIPPFILILALAMVSIFLFFILERYENTHQMKSANRL